jgi:hypothetical protein
VAHARYLRESRRGSQDLGQDRVRPFATALLGVLIDDLLEVALG